MNFALRIPDYYKEDIEELKGGVSINQFIVNAVAEKIASLKTVNHLQDRADRSTIDEMMRIMNKVEDREPMAQDKR